VIEGDLLDKKAYRNLYILINNSVVKSASLIFHIMKQKHQF